MSSQFIFFAWNRQSPFHSCLVVAPFENLAPFSSCPGLKSETTTVLICLKIFAIEGVNVFVIICSLAQAYRLISAKSFFVVKLEMTLKWSVVLKMRWSFFCCLSPPHKDFTSVQFQFWQLLKPHSFKFVCAYSSIWVKISCYIFVMSAIGYAFNNSFEAFVTVVFHIIMHCWHYRQRTAVPESVRCPIF